MATRQQLTSIWIAIGLVAIAAIIGWGSPQAKTASQVQARFRQSGTSTCSIVALTYKNICSISFPSAFASSPATNSTEIEFATNSLTWGGGTNVPLVSATFESPDALSVATCCTWTNMPSPNTELYGLTDNRAIFNPGPVQQVQLSVVVVTGSTGSSPTLELDSNSNSACTGTWTGLVTVSIVTPGTIAALNSIPAGTLLTGNNCFRISGTNGGGVGDSPQFGMILASFQTIEQGFTIDKTSVTTTTLNYFIAVTPVLALAKTLTVTWSAYICQNGTSNC